MEINRNLTPEESYTARLSGILFDEDWQATPNETYHMQRRSKEITIAAGGKLILSQYCSAKDLGRWSNGINLEITGLTSSFNWRRDGEDLKNRRVSLPKLDAIIGIAEAHIKLEQVAAANEI